MPLKYATLIPADRREEPVLADFLQLYAREFRAFHPVPFESDGRFVYRALPDYWTHPDKHIFFIEIGREKAGFVFVQQVDPSGESEPVWDISEFFILANYRRNGIGTDVAHSVWRRFPGNWQIRVLHANQPALHFWRQAITRFTGNPAKSNDIEREGESWRVFTFEAAAAPVP